ncbi:hypothetical protein ACYX7E_18555 [Luteimonas sp. RIT-PG2_3]
MQPALLALAGLSLIVAAYWLGLSGGFVFDDYPNIVSQGKVHLAGFSWRGLWDAAFAYHPGGGLPRPISNATFALNYWADGLNPIGYKWTNLLIHLVNYVLLGAWLRQVLLVTGITPRHAEITAGAIALLWAIHPLQVSSVLYVVQRMELLCLTFMLASLLAYTSARTAQIKEAHYGLGALLAALLFAGLAFATKETGALTALYGLALEWLVFRGRAASPAWSRFWKLAMIVGALAFAAAFAWLTIRTYSSPTTYSMRDYGPNERLLSQLQIVPLYLGQILLPRPDSMLFFYDHLVAPAKPTPAIIAGGALLLALIAAAILFARRIPLLSLGIAIFLASHVITSSPIPLELAFEHRNYFAIAGTLLAVVAVMLRLPALNPRVLLLVFVVLALGFATLTALRSASWGTPYGLAAYSVEINPRSTRAAMDLAEQYMLAAKKDTRSPYYSMALHEFERAAALPQGSIMGEHGLVMMTADFGVPARPEWWQSMRRKLSTPPIRPQEVDAVVSMIEHRNRGLPLDDTELASISLTVARTQSLSPELLFLFAQQALLANDNAQTARELYARGLVAIGNDEEYRDRVRQAISRQVNKSFLTRVDETAQQLGQIP